MENIDKIMTTIDVIPLINQGSGIYRASIYHFEDYEILDIFEKKGEIYLLLKKKI